MAIQGLRSTSDFVTDQRPKNWREGYLYLEPNGDAPLAGLTSQMKSRTVDDPEFHWWDKTRNTQRYELHATNGDLTTTNTTLTLAATEEARTLKDGDLLYVEQNGEILQVNGDPTSATSVVVTRGFAGTTPAALDANGVGINPKLSKIGSAYEEGSLAPTSVRYDPTKRTNYTQIFRDTLAFTRTAMKTKLRTPDDVKEAKKECLEYHMAGIERAFWFGVASESTRNGEPMRSTDGILNVIPASNKVNANTDYAAGLTMAGLEDYLRQAFTYGSNEKMGFLGNNALLVINQICRRNSQFQIQSGIKEYGMDVSRLISPFGTLVLKTHKMFNQLTGGTTTGAAYYGMAHKLIILDMANLQYVSLNGSDTEYESDLTPKGLDGMKSGYITEAAIQVGLGSTHFAISGLNRAAVDS